MGQASRPKSKELLKDESKHIQCNFIGCEDLCPDTCQNCAIGLKTFGDMALMQGDSGQAFNFYLESVTKNSLFAEAWNNMGNAHAAMGNYENALGAFDVALMIDPVYGKAMLGKALTLKNLQRMPEAIQVLDSILELYDNENCKRLRLEVIGLMSSDDENDSIQKQRADTNLIIRDILTSEGIKAGYLRDGLPFVPELNFISADFLIKISQNISKIVDGIGFISVSLQWAFYGGIGAAYHWNENWQDLRERGIFQLLTKERGVEEMDEYVVDLSGIGYDSENGKTLSEFSQKCAEITFEKAFFCSFEKEQDPKDFVDKLMVAMQAHFSLGVGVALNRLGMS